MQLICGQHLPIKSWISAHGNKYKGQQVVGQVLASCSQNLLMECNQSTLVEQLIDYEIMPHQFHESHNQMFHWSPIELPSWMYFLCTKIVTLWDLIWRLDLFSNKERHFGLLSYQYIREHGKIKGSHSSHFSPLEKIRNKNQRVSSQFQEQV